MFWGSVFVLVNHTANLGETAKSFCSSDTVVALMWPSVNMAAFTVIFFAVTVTSTKLNTMKYCCNEKYPDQIIPESKIKWDEKLQINHHLFFYFCSLSWRPRRWDDSLTSCHSSQSTFKLFSNVWNVYYLAQRWSTLSTDYFFMFWIPFQQAIKIVELSREN